MSDIIVGDKQDLVAVADSIRNLIGGGQMYVSEMAANINGAKTAVDAALAALSEKGVEVPDGTKVDGLAALIEAIEAGGGGIPSNITEIVGGTYTAAKKLDQSLYITHGMGKTPSMAVLWSESTNTTGIGWGVFFGGGGGYFGYGKGTELAYADLSGGWRRGEVLDSNQLKASLSNTGTSADAGDTFHWLAWV